MKLKKLHMPYSNFFKFGCGWKMKIEFCNYAVIIIDLNMTNTINHRQMSHRVDIYSTIE